MLRGLGDMLSNVAGGEALVLDARPAGRFAGTAPEPRPGLPSGHMPGSVSLPAGELLVDGRRFLPAETLRARFASAGVDGRRPVITSCGTGVTAAVLTMGMVLAGLPEGALYDGSWTEWAGHADTPKVRS
jgi:thiosulfate/3-mercaptopyruvate sulfurtransferase